VHQSATSTTSSCGPVLAPAGDFWFSHIRLVLRYYPSGERTCAPYVIGGARPPLLRYQHRLIIWDLPPCALAMNIGLPLLHPRRACGDVPGNLPARGGVLRPRGDPSRERFSSMSLQKKKLHIWARSRIRKDIRRVPNQSGSIAVLTYGEGLPINFPHMFAPTTTACRGVAWPVGSLAVGVITLMRLGRPLAWKSERVPRFTECNVRSSMSNSGAPNPSFESSGNA